MLTAEFEKHTAAGHYDNPWWGRPSYLIHSREFEKTAATIYIPSEIEACIGNLRPRDDGVYTLIHAMGACESYGNNYNGDRFNSWSCTGSLPPDHVIQLCRDKGLPIRPLGKYGYKTFVEYAYPYRQHENYDPKLSIGEKVIAGAWNEQMQRVELIVFVSTVKAPDVVQKLNAGLPVYWSMGAKLQFDVCSICYNGARNRLEYCDHLRFQMNKIFPDGRIVGAYNFFPRFFDISEVVKPADRSAYSLRKVAAHETDGLIPINDPRGHYYLAPEGLLKVASADVFSQAKTAESKLAELIKEVPPEVPSENMGPAPISPQLLCMLQNLINKDQSEAKDMPDPVLDELRKKPKSSIVTITSVGIKMSPREHDIVTDNGANLPGSLDFGNLDNKVLDVIKNFIGGRSMFDPVFTDRVQHMDPSCIAAPIVKTAAYRRYEDLVRLTNHDLFVKVASDSRIRSLIDPCYLQKSMLKVGSVLSPEEVVLPFLLSFKI